MSRREGAARIESPGSWPSVRISRYAGTRDDRTTIAHFRLSTHCETPARRAPNAVAEARAYAERELRPARGASEFRPQRQPAQHGARHLLLHTSRTGEGGADCVQGDTGSAISSVSGAAGSTPRFMPWRCTASARAAPCQSRFRFLPRSHGGRVARPATAVARCENMPRATPSGVPLRAEHEPADDGGPAALRLRAGGGGGPPGRSSAPASRTLASRRQPPTKLRITRRSRVFAGATPVAIAAPRLSRQDGYFSPCAWGPSGRSLD
jgi:hypothetical protein